MHLLIARIVRFGSGLRNVEQKIRDGGLNFKMAVVLWNFSPTALQIGLDYPDASVMLLLGISPIYLGIISGSFMDSFWRFPQEILQKLIYGFKSPFSKLIQKFSLGISPDTPGKFPDESPEGHPEAEEAPGKFSETQGTPE